MTNHRNTGSHNSYENGSSSTTSSSSSSRSSSSSFGHRRVIRYTNRTMGTLFGFVVLVSILRIVVPSLFQSSNNPQEYWRQYYNSLSFSTTTTTTSSPSSSSSSSTTTTTSVGTIENEEKESSSLSSTLPPTTTPRSVMTTHEPITTTATTTIPAATSPDTTSTTATTIATTINQDTDDENSINEMDTEYFSTNPNMIPILHERPNMDGPVITINDMNHMHRMICHHNHHHPNNQNQDDSTPTNTTNVARGHVLFRDACLSDSTGNMLGYIYLAALYANTQQMTFQLDCPRSSSEPNSHPDNTVQGLLSTTTTIVSTQEGNDTTKEEEKEEFVVVPNIWYFDPSVTMQMTTSTSLPRIDFCVTLQHDYPHKYRYGLQYVAPLIRTTLRQAFPFPTSYFPITTTATTTTSRSKEEQDTPTTITINTNTTINDAATDDTNTTTTTTTTIKDDVAIHIRCGDVLKYAHHIEYGYPRYDFYRQTIQDYFFNKNNHDSNYYSSDKEENATTTTLSMAIVTASWDPSQCRLEKDCDFIDTCRRIITDLQMYLVDQFPMSTVQIYSHESTSNSYARIIHASLNICNPSTFCVFPAIAAYGESYIVASQHLYPFVEELPAIYDNIHIARVEFLNMKEIDEFRKKGLDIVTAITQWARESVPVTLVEVETSSGSVPDTLDDRWMEEPSRIEMIQDEFMVLTNVCLTNGAQNQGPYVVHWFDTPETEEDKNDDPIRLFQEKLVPYTAWESDLPTGLPFEGTPTTVRTNKTMREFLMEQQQEMTSSNMVWNGTTVIAEPHHPDNNFHLHNDLILPVLYKIIKSSTNEFPKDHRITLLLTHGCERRYKQRVVAFDVLYQLFDDVRYSLEQIMSEPSNGGILCFERLILGGRLTTLMPYYSHRGRFGNDDRWRGIVPQIRDWVNSIYGINVTRTPDQNWSDNSTAKPQLTFVDRPCTETDTRCLRNAPDLIYNLSQKFDVKVLSFNKEHSRLEQFTNMLERMANTDILVGMHGAGLAHAMYLQPRTIFVEIKDGSNRDKKLFLNMASIQDIGYYLYDALPASKSSPNTILSDKEIERFTEDLWSAWEQELVYLQVQNASDPVLRGECLFPEYLKEELATLSSFDLSRCYLEQAAAYDNEWWQCTHYKGCTFR